MARYSPALRAVGLRELREELARIASAIDALESGERDEALPRVSLLGDTNDFLAHGMFDLQGVEVDPGVAQPVITGVVEPPAGFHGTLTITNVSFLQNLELATNSTLSKRRNLLRLPNGERLVLQPRASVTLKYLRSEGYWSAVSHSAWPDDRNVINWEGTQNFIGATNFTGLATFNGGATVAAGGLDVNGGGIDVNAGGVTVNAGGVDINAGGIDVTGSSIFRNAVEFDAAANFDGQVDFNADVDFNSTSAFTGLATFGAVNIGGALNANGQVDINADLDVNSTSRFTGAANFDGQVDFNADVDFNSTSTFTGLATFGAVTIGGVLNTNGQVDINADLDVNSTSTFLGAVTLGASAIFTTNAEAFFNFTVEVAGTATFNGPVVFSTRTLTSGSNLNNVAVGDDTVIKIDATANIDLTGFSGGVEGRYLIVINDGTGGDIAVRRASASSSTGNQIVFTPRGAADIITLGTRDVIELLYVDAIGDNGNGFWYVLGHTGILS